MAKAAELGLKPAYAEDYYTLGQRCLAIVHEQHTPKRNDEPIAPAVQNAIAGFVSTHTTSRPRKAPRDETTEQRIARLEAEKARQLALVAQSQRAKANGADPSPPVDHEPPRISASASSPSIATSVPPKPKPDAWKTDDAACYAKAIELHIPLQGMTWTAIRKAIEQRTSP